MRRREFIKTVCVASAVGTGLLVGCKSTPILVQGTIKDNKLYVPLAEFESTNTLSVAFESSAIGVTKVNDSQYVAVLLKCTHMGCAVIQEGNKNSTEQVGFICPCHGAKFSAGGEVLKGPAQKNLTQYTTSNDHEFVIIQL